MTQVLDRKHVLSIIVILIGFFGVTSAVSCYHCNSEYDPRCGDPFDPYSLGEVNCSMQLPLEHLPNKEPYLCRKTTYKAGGKIRVLRGCGYIGDSTENSPECLAKLGTFEVKSLFCACTDNYCNDSQRPILSFAAILLIISLILLTIFIEH